jgi:uncharacterized protein
MKNLLVKLLRLTLGFLLCAFSTVLALHSNLGLSPWDVFHQGLANVTGMTIGQASILTGVIIVIVTRIAGLEIGLGTVANMIVIGCFIDLIIYTNIIPVSDNLLTGILMIIASLIVCAFGGYLYIGCAMGCGPRDGLMVALVKYTGKPISLVRLCIESSALVAGWLMGGKIGIGTLITAFGLGVCLQLVFKMFKVDIKAIEHHSFRQSIVILKETVTGLLHVKNPTVL